MPMMSQSFSTSIMICWENRTVLSYFRHSRMKPMSDGAVVMSRPQDAPSRTITVVCVHRNGGQHAQRGGLAGAVGAEQTVDLAGLAAETDVFDGANHAALLVLKLLRKIARFDHEDSSGKLDTPTQTLSYYARASDKFQSIRFRRGRVILPGV